MEFTEAWEGPNPILKALRGYSIPFTSQPSLSPLTDTLKMQFQTKISKSIILNYLHDFLLVCQDPSILISQVGRAIETL